MISPRHYTVDPMLSASGNLFKCHEEVLFYLLPVVLVFYIVYPEYFVCRGGGIASSSFFEKNKKNKKNKKKHPRSESNPGFQSAREMLARFSQGFIYAPGIPMESKPLACGR